MSDDTSAHLLGIRITVRVCSRISGRVFLLTARGVPPVTDVDCVNDGCSDPGSSFSAIIFLHFLSYFSGIRCRDVAQTPTVGETPLRSILCRILQTAIF